MKELEFGPAEYIMELQLVRSICIFSALQQTLERAISLALSVSLYVLDGWGIQWGGGGWESGVAAATAAGGLMPVRPSFRPIDAAGTSLSGFRKVSSPCRCEDRFDNMQGTPPKGPQGSSSPAKHS